MAELIDKLTDEQEAQIPVYRDKGLSIGLCTDSCNREQAIEAIKHLYQYIEKEVPTKFIFVRSPFEAQIIANELKLHDPDDIILNAWTFEENDVWRDKLIKSQTDADSYTFFATHNYGYGSNEAFWVAFYEYFRDVCGIKYEEKSEEGLEIFSELAKNSGWHYLFDKCAILCDRPIRIMIEQNQLHCDDGPAIEYSDGVKIYSIGGHVVTEQIVMKPETLTIDQIQNETDSETLRIMIHRYGVDKYLLETGAEVIDSDRLGFEGSSLRTLIRDNKGNQWLIGTDGSTGRVYHMPAPSDATSCKQAHEAMGGINEDNLIGEC